MPPPVTLLDCSLPWLRARLRVLLCVGHRVPSPLWLRSLFDRGCCSGFLLCGPVPLVTPLGLRGPDSSPLRPLLLLSRGRLREVSFARPPLALLLRGSPPSWGYTAPLGTDMFSETRLPRPLLGGRSSSVLVAPPPPPLTVELAAQVIVVLPPGCTGCERYRVYPGLVDLDKPD